MKRKLNLKLVLSVLGGLLVVGIGVHFLHAYQLERNAHRLLERADRARDAKEFEKAEFYYGQYLTFVSDDADTVQKLAQMLDPRADTVGERVRLVLLMEQVLRQKPNEQALRIRLVHHLIALERIPEAIDNLRRLERTWPDRAEILHMLGWCLEAKKEYVSATKALEEAIRANPKQLKSYAILVEVLHDRLSQPDDALKVVDAMIRDNADSYEAYLARARLHQRRHDKKAADEDLAQAFKRAPDRPDVIYAVADAARARGDWVEAERLLKDAMKRFPAHSDFYRLMVNVHLDNKNDAQALKVLQDAVHNAPKSPELAVLLIDLMIERQQYQDARTRIDELRRTDVRPTLPNYLTARLHIADKKWQEAIALLESVRRDLGPVSEWNSRVNVLLGVAYQHLGDHEQELQAFQKAALEDPNWATANLGLGQAYLNNGRFAEASQALEPLHAMKDLPAGYWLLLSRTRIFAQLALREEVRDWSAVEQALDKAAKDDAGPAVALVRAEMHAARNQYAEAKAALEKARSEHPTQVALWCALAELAARQNRLDDAETILEQAAANGFRDRLEVRFAQVRLWGMRGSHSDLNKLARLGDARDIALPAEQRTRLARELAETWYRLGIFERAESVWRSLARELPKDLRSRFALLELALQKNQPEAARIWQDELRKIEGERGWLWRYGAVALLVQEAKGRRSQLDDARKKLLELEQVHKNWSRIPLLAGNISELEGKYHQAIQEYTRALDLGETQPRVLTRLLELLIERREFDKAKAELSRYEQKRPLSRELARLGAEVSLGVREMPQAVKRAEWAITLPTRDYRDALWLARIYQAAEENAKAEAILRDALAEAGHVPDVWVAWLGHLTLTNQRDAALGDLERMKKELPAPRQGLALAQAFEAMRMPEKADTAYQAALRDRPNEFVLIAYAADFYRRADRHAEARKLYERLLDPYLGAAADSTAKARRHLAVLLAASARTQALDLLAENKQARGDTIADERVRLFVESQTASKRENAIAKFQESLRVQLPTPDERVLLAQMLDAGGQAAQARAQLADAIAEAPTAAEYRVPYIRLLIRAEEWDDARRHFASLETLEPASERVKELRQALSRGN